MKTLPHPPSRASHARLPLLAALTLLLALTCAAPGCATRATDAGRTGPSPIAFKTSRAQFADGDSIVIQEVAASSPELKVGDTVIVRGVYRLESAPEAMLGLSLTTRGPGPATRIAPHQRQKIAAGEGAFELKHVVPAEGSLHVSFYPARGGSSFGGVYFAPEKR